MCRTLRPSATWVTAHSMAANACLLVFFSLHACLGQQSPPFLSPCPNVFSYEWANGWRGVVTVLPPTRFSEIKLEVLLGSKAAVPQDALGKIELKSSTDDVVKRVLNGERHPVQFYVDFPTVGPIPPIYGIRVNGREFCPGTTPAGTQTIIKLQSLLKTGLTVPDSNGEDFGIVARPGIPESISEGPVTVDPVRSSPVPAFPVTESPVVYIEQTPRPDKPVETSKEEVPKAETLNPKLDEEYYGDCGIPRLPPNFLIVSGQSTARGQWPWHVALFKKVGVGLTFQCGGTLVSKKHILTAAHCVQQKNRKKPARPDSLVVYLGKHNLRSWTEVGAQAREIEKVVVHPDYGKNNYDSDVAVLLMSNSAEFSTFVRPACLWDRPPSLTPLVDKLGIVVGWGKDENGDISDDLQMTKMPIVSQETCLRSDVFFSVFTSDRTYCAGFRNGTGACNGDSGGGMFFFLYNPSRRITTWYIRGIVSVGMFEAQEQMCDTKNFVVFTDIAKFVPWLTEQM